MSTIVTRAGKGAPLTAAEADANFTNLNTDKFEKSGGQITGAVGMGVTPNAGWGAALRPIQGQGHAMWSDSATSAIFAANLYNDGGNYRAATTGNASFYYQSSGVHYWYSANSVAAGAIPALTPVMVVDVSGRLHVGTAGSAQNGTGSDNVLGFSVNPGAATAAVIQNSSNNNLYLAKVPGYTNGGLIQFYVNGVAVGSVTTGGTTTSYNTTSDARLKTAVQDADAGGQVVDSIRIRKFDWSSTGEHQRYGVIAQELKTVFPEAVHEPADPGEMMAVDYSKLVPLLVKEIQSLRARVTALEAA